MHSANMTSIQVRAESLEKDLASMKPETKERIRELLSEPVSKMLCADFTDLVEEVRLLHHPTTDVIVKRFVDLLHQMNCLHRIAMFSTLHRHVGVLVAIHPHVSHLVVATVNRDPKCQPYTIKSANWDGLDVVDAWLSTWAPSLGELG